MISAATRRRSSRGMGEGGEPGIDDQVQYANPEYDISTGTVSVQELQQQYKQGLFSNPQVPSQYDVGTSYNPQSQYERYLLNADPNTYVTYSGLAPIPGQENTKFAFYDASGNLVRSSVQTPKARTGLVVSPATGTTVDTSTLTGGLMAWLSTPVFAAYPGFTWMWALAAAALGLLVLRER